MALISLCARCARFGEELQPEEFWQARFYNVNDWTKKDCSKDDDTR
jgi:hypothetical protein